MQLARLQLARPTREFPRRALSHAGWQDPLLILSQADAPSERSSRSEREKVQTWRLRPAQRALPSFPVNQRALWVRRLQILFPSAAFRPELQSRRLFGPRE